MNVSIFFFTILANPLPMPYKKNWHRRLPSQTIYRIFRSKIRTALSKIAQSKNKNWKSIVVFHSKP
ncbi:hypothetical protein Hanom_Chr07g00593451 [Helianthus anomalus]